jgi:MATE family multidrug resistance protein
VTPLTRSLSSLLRTLARLAAPVAVARLGIMGMGIADTIVVGQLAPAELPALALGWAPTAVLLVGGIGFLMGVQVLTAHAVGERRAAEAGAVWRRGLVLAGAAGAIGAACLAALVEPLLNWFGIDGALARASAAVARILGVGLSLHFGYVCCAFFVEAIKRPLPGTAVIWLANLVNLGLNLLLVPRLGARGAACATVGARAFMFLALAAWILLSPTGRRHGVRRWTPAPSYRALLGVGTAAAVSQFAEAGAFSLMTVIAGRIGAQAVATYQLLLNLLAVVFMLSLGTAAATAVLVGEAYGQRRREEVGRVTWAGLAMNSAAMVLCAVVLFAARKPIAATLTSDTTLAGLVVGLTPLAAAVLLPDGGQVVVANALRARGDNWLPTASHLLAYVLVMPPLAWWLGEHLGLGVAGLMEAILIASVLSVSVLTVRVACIDRRRE